MDIDKNDVDLTKLFKWNKEVEIRDEKGNVVTSVFMRLVGDAEVNKSRVFALRESANLRKALNTEGSEEREAFIADLDIRGSKFIAKAITILAINSIANEARRKVLIEIPREPDSDASLDEQERYQNSIDSFPLEYANKLEEAMSEISKRMEENMLSLPKEELEKEYENAMISSLCSNRMSNRFQDMCVFLGTFSDEEMKERKFSSFEEYDNLATEVKEQLVDAYINLDMPVEKLKKLPEATQ